MIFQARTDTTIAWLKAMLRLEMLSADLAIGAGSAFVAVVAVASLFVDHDDAAGLGNAGGSWSLRGSLAPIEQPAPSHRYDVRLPHQAHLSSLW